MNEHQTDLDWERIGRTAPYWGVLTQDEYRGAALDGPRRAAFFATGEERIEQLFRTARAHLDPAFAPRRALDFGCGVGRLTVPLAERCAAVVAVDVSESMLREAAKNCAARGLANVELVRGDDGLTAVTGRFDLVHTDIVLQHIPTARGFRIFRRLTELVADGGCGAVHVTYSKAEFGPVPAGGFADYPQIAIPGGGRFHLARLVRALRVRWTNRGRRRPPAAPAGPEAPLLQMNPYVLNPLLHVLQAAGVREFFTEFTDHGADLGVMMYFRKPPAG
ncbi:MAG TPA: methyltransferase domain-containing protein [Gemmataceae bacterium]|jgi:SAM-dependent methyltransferase|nr:methyltransferase domain-containing protein [Gemmataceae bacterium]